jgi:hypothetical protein
MEQASAKRLCPKCKKGFLDYRTPRAFWVKTLLFWLPIRRYKCSYCDKKTYVYGDLAKTTTEVNTNKLEVVKNND